MIMCGIAGMISLETKESTIEKMLRTMYRRGPDEGGVYREGGCALLHRRLAIIDLAGGKQPMELQSNGERYVLVYNGELYNTEEIRRELLKLGHSFEGHSDTEVVLHAYTQWEEACVERFNGIFAFAVWEQQKKRLFLARDRIGVKPLFYMDHDGGFLFASEMKTILAYPGVKAQLNEEGASEILLMGPGRTPGCGVFHGMKEVEPGYCGYWQDGRLKLWQYWRLRDREYRESFEDTAAQVRFLVEDAVRRQMVSDVCIGTFLSGGLDSSLITAICAKELDTPLDTFSVDYVDNDRYFQANKFQPNSDGDYIRMMMDAANTNHHWTVLSPEDLVGALEDATIARDLPGMADVDFSLLAFCKDVRKEVKVALSGECADEIFGGYPWYRDPEVRAVNGFPWAQNRTQRCRMMNQTIKVDPDAYIQDRYLDTCRQSDILPGTNPEERRMKEMMNLNFRWFMQTLLDRKDRMSMYSSLEVRVPFCDYRIAEYLYGVPWAFKDHGNQEKGLLRTAMAGWLPEDVLWRKKSPYPKTFHPRYESIVTEKLKVLLDERGNALWYLVNRQEAENLLDRDAVWPWYGQLMRRPQTISYLLQIEFWLRYYQVEFLF